MRGKRAALEFQGGDEVVVIRVLAVAWVLLLSACGGSGSSGGSGVAPSTNVSLDEGNVSVLDENRTYELIPGGGTVGGASVVEWRWSNNPVNAGALPACSNENGFDPQLAAQRLDAACTDATQCTIDFDQKLSADGETTFDLTIPVLKAPIGLTYQLTSVTAAQETMVGNFTFCLIAINEAPSATADVFTATEGTTLNISASTGLNLLSNDTDDNDLSNKPLAVNPTPVTPPALSTEFSLQADGGFSYLYVGAADVPAGQSVADSFVYEITDGFNKSTATVTINIGTSDKPPRAIDSIPDQTIVAGVEKPFDLSTFFVDPENGELIFAAVSDTLPSGGSLVITELGEFKGVAATSDVGDYTVRFTVSDQVSASEATNAPLEASFKLVIRPNQVPTVASIEDLQNAFGELISIGLAQYFSDPEDQSLSFSVQTEPSSTLQINESSGLLTGQLRVPGKYVVTVTANDGTSGPVSQSFTIEQLPSPSQAPVAGAPQPNVETRIGESMVPITAAFTDPDNQTLIYAINTLPPGLNFNTATGVLSGTPTMLGSFSLRFSATDEDDLSASSNTFNFQVSALPNNPPVANTVIANQTIELGQSINPANGNFTDPDGDELNYTFSPPLDGLTGYSFNNGTLSGTPANAGSTVFTISASDGTVTVMTNAFTITVNAPTPTNSAPVHVGSIGNQSIVLGSAITAVSGTFTDADGDTLSYSIAPAVAGSGLSFNPNSGTLSGTPTAAGSVVYRISASDGTATTASNNFTIAVSAPQNNAPVAGSAIQNQVVTLGSAISPANAGFTDPDGDTLAYQITPSLAGLTGYSFNANTGTLSGTPANAGSTVFTISASDGTVTVDSSPFTVTVNPPLNTAPALGSPIGNQAIVLGDPITAINGNFTDADGDTLSYSVAPSVSNTGLSFSTSSGTLSGVPSAAGSVAYTITASDGTASTPSNEFTLAVSAPQNAAPVAGAPIQNQVITLGASITPINGSFTDPDGDSLSYSITPSVAGTGLAFSTSTGILSGEPSAITPVGDPPLSFRIRAFDGVLGTMSNQFTITVNAPVQVNLPPVQGNQIADQAVDAGSPINDINGAFTDPDTGDVLSYALTPAAGTGLLFDATTGTLSGAPDTVGVESYRITASDGLATTDSNVFTITVQPVNSAPVPGPAVAQQIVVAGTQITPVNGGFQDPEGDPMTFSITPAASTAGLDFDVITGTLSGAPTVVRTHTFFITATDDSNLSANSPDFTIVVTPSIVPPPPPIPTSSSSA